MIESIEKLSTGKTYNLKGDLFEMAVGYYHGQLCKVLEISKTVSHDSELREIDVYAVYQDKVVFAECKGYNSKIDDEYVEKWLSKKIPVIRNWALSCESLCDKQMVFEIWSTGGFTDDATKRLSTTHQKTKKYQIDFYDYPQMLDLAKEKKFVTSQRLSGHIIQRKYKMVIHACYSKGHVSMNRSKYFVNFAE